MLEENAQFPPSDHDLLVELKTELKGMRFDLNRYADDSKERLLLLGSNKLEKETFSTFLIEDGKFKTDHETRVRRIELWGAMAIGGLYLLQIIIGVYLTRK